MLFIKFGFDWPSGFRGGEVSIYYFMKIYMYIASGQGQTTPRGKNLSININHPVM